MVNLRLRYENGLFIPLDPVLDIAEGQEVLVNLQKAHQATELDTMLDRTRGLWADSDRDGIEDMLAENRQLI